MYYNRSDFIIVLFDDLAMEIAMEKERHKKKRRLEIEKQMKSEDRYRDQTITDEELIRWMTEGTNKNLAPRSDSG